MKSVFIVGLVCLACFVSAQHEEYVANSNDMNVTLRIVAIVILVILSAIVAGLTLGLNSVDITVLAVKEIAGTPEEREQASRILSIRKNNHILLVTLLATNTVINETIPILFDHIFSAGLLSIMVSTVIIVTLAEILPQAFFMKHILAVGSFFSKPARVLIFICYPISWPISKLLDMICGRHLGHTYNLAELGALVKLNDKSVYERGALYSETAQLVQNTLYMQDTSLDKIIHTSMEMMSFDTKLTPARVVQYASRESHLLFVYKCDDLEKTNQRIIGVYDLQVLLELDEKEIATLNKEKYMKTCIEMLETTTVAEAMHQLIQSKNRDVVILVKRKQQIKISESCATLVSSTSASSFFKRTSSNISLYGSPTEKEDTAEEVISIRPTLEIDTNESVVGYITLADILSQLARTIEHEPIKESNEKLNLRLLLKKFISPIRSKAP